jgi:crotonobetainyl-CoA:carnitine CoA-transferase CaiB-like acyl-CoA transferase
MHASLLIVAGVLLALEQRHRTGKGQRVDISLLDAALHLQSDFLTYALNGWDYHSGPLEDQPYGSYGTKDSRIALAHAPMATLSGLLEEPELAGISEAEQFSRRAEIREIVQRRLVTRTTQEWLEIFEPAGIWCAPLRTYDEVLDSQIVLTSAKRWELQHPTAGKVTTIAPPVSLSASPGTLRRNPPMLGEHSIEVLRELGYQDAEIETMKREGVTQPHQATTVGREG